MNFVKNNNMSSPQRLAETSQASAKRSVGFKQTSSIQSSAPRRAAEGPSLVDIGKGYSLGVVPREGTKPLDYPLSMCLRSGSLGVHYSDAVCGNIWKFHDLTAKGAAFSSQKMAKRTMTRLQTALSESGYSGNVEGSESCGSSSMGVPDVQAGVRLYAVYCSNVSAEHSVTGDRQFLTPKLTLTRDVKQAEMFEVAPYTLEEERQDALGLQGEVALQIVTYGTGQVLCADMSRGMCAFVASNALNVRVPATGELRYSTAWRARIDQDLPESVLAELLGRIAFPAGA